MGKECRTAGVVVISNVDYVDGFSNEWSFSTPESPVIGWSIHRCNG